MGIGSGVLIMETGISLQNQDADFSLDTSYPNALKFRKQQGDRAFRSYWRIYVATGAFLDTLDYLLNSQATLDVPR